MALKNGRCSLILAALSMMSLAKQVIVFSQGVSTPRYRPWKVIWTLKRQIINDSSRWTLLCSFLRLSYLNLTSTAVVSSSFHTAFVFARSGDWGGGGDQINVFQEPIMMGSCVFIFSFISPSWLASVPAFLWFSCLSCISIYVTERSLHENGFIKNRF